MTRLRVSSTFEFKYFLFIPISKLFISKFYIPVQRTSERSQTDVGIGAYKTFSLLQFTHTGYKNFTSFSILLVQVITKIKTQDKLSSYEWRMRWLGNWNVGHLLHYGSPFLPNARSDRTASCAAVVSGPPCAGLWVAVLPPGRRLRCQRW